jgi:hypothetical protein
VFEAELEALNWKGVTSSSVERLAFRATGPGHEAVHTPEGVERVEAELGEVFVEFKASKPEEENRIYCYYDVPRRRFVHVLDAESVGSMLNKIIKPHYSYEEIVALPEPPEFDEDPALKLLEEIRDGQREVIGQLKQLNAHLGQLRRVPPKPVPTTQGA